MWSTTELEVTVGDPPPTVRPELIDQARLRSPFRSLVGSCVELADNTALATTAWLSSRIQDESRLRKCLKGDPPLPWQNLQSHVDWERSCSCGKDFTGKELIVKPHFVYSSQTQKARPRPTPRPGLKLQDGKRLSFL